MKINKRIFLNLFIIIFVFIFYQISKSYVIYYLDLNNKEIYLTNFLNLQLIWNEGIAFGLLSSDNNFFYNLITLVIFIVIIILLFLI